MRFWYLLGLVLIPLSGVVVSLEASRGDWSIATEVQKYYRCLPFGVYIVDHTDVAAAKGELVQFEAPMAAIHLPTKFDVIKLVVGVEGDSWEIRDNRIFVNNEDFGELYLLEPLKIDASELEQKGVVPENHVFVIGTNPSSYDSRYWGPLDTRKIRGKAYVVV